MPREAGLFLPEVCALLSDMCAGLTIALLRRWLITIAVGVLVFAGRGASWAQGNAPARSKLDTAYRNQLETLAAKCDQLDLPEQAAISRRWASLRDPGRYYLFMPAPNDPVRPPAKARAIVRSWYKKFTEYRKEQAKQLFLLAGQEARAGHGAEAYQLLHEVLREDPDHAETRRVLGYIATSSGWRNPQQRIRRRPGTSIHPTFGWQRKRYWKIDSGHFQVTTNANPKIGIEVVKFLERVHAVWRQLFFDYWSTSKQLTARLEGGRTTLGPEPKFQVVVFRDRDEYVQQLGRFESQIGISVGYYSQTAKTAYFFADEKKTHRSWVHEATHQFFQETRPTTKQVGEQGNFWVIEAVALYMESLVCHDHYCTTGGVDAERLQYARYRGLCERNLRPLAKLVALGRTEFQKDQDVRRLYSQSAGLAHFFMHADSRRLARPLVQYLLAVYQRRDGPQTLQQLAGCDDTEIDRDYIQFLNVTDQQLQFVDPMCRKLCLCHTDVTDQGLLKLPELPQLRWLDLSFTKASCRGLARFADCRQLDQLSLEKTSIDDQAIATIGRFVKLEELDLSRTRVGDEGLRMLPRLSRLKILWLTGTQVTDHGIEGLARFRNLEQLELENTRVTAVAIQRLKRQLPGLK